jgi:hypothetical protein
MEKWFLSYRLSTGIQLHFNHLVEFHIMSLKKLGMELYQIDLVSYRDTLNKQIDIVLMPRT